MDEQRAKTVFETAPYAIITINSEGLITAWNAQAEKTFGWLAGEVLGRRLAQTILPQVHRESFEKGLGAFIGTGESLPWSKPGEIAALHRNGVEFPVELAISANKNPLDWSFNIFLHDISERKRKTETADDKQVKSRFLANMNHELRTPMNGVIGMTELVLDSELTPEQRNCLSIVMRSAESLLKSIDDILDYSAIEARMVQLMNAEFNLQATLATAIHAVEAQAHEKNLVLAWEVSPGVPDKVTGDAARLRQILINLLGNAIKFTQNGGVNLRVEKISENDGETILYFSVSDTGIGITEEKQQLIFQAFTQADSSSTRQFTGTGLGLAIASELIAMMNGRIWVQSELGKGSTFQFTARFGSR